MTEFSSLRELLLQNYEEKIMVSDSTDISSLRDLGVGWADGVYRYAVPTGLGCWLGHRGSTDMPSLRDSYTIAGVRHILSPVGTIYR
jgi:hypothetical protein